MSRELRGKVVDPKDMTPGQRAAAETISASAAAHGHETPVTCECGAWVARDADKGAGYAHWWHEESLDGRGQTYCHECHTELFFDSEGQPVATPMVPRERIEDARWLIGILYHVALSAPEGMEKLPKKAQEVAEAIWLHEVEKAMGGVSDADIEAVCEGTALAAQEEADADE